MIFTTEMLNVPVFGLGANLTRIPLDTAKTA